MRAEWGLFNYDIALLNRQPDPYFQSDCLEADYDVDIGADRCFRSDKPLYYEQSVRGFS